MPPGSAWRVGPDVGRLNLFQAVMLRWRDLHPYCAAHVVDLATPLDTGRLATTIAGVLEAAGLTGLALDRRRGRYVFAGGPAQVALDVEPAGDDVDAAVAAAIERRINVAFPSDGALDPFLFFAVPTPAGFRLGISYDHVFAGGDSIAVLLSWIATRYQAPADAAVAVPRLGVDPPGYGRLFAAQLRALIGGLPALSGLVRAARRSVRPRVEHPEDGRNGFLRIPLAPGRNDALRAAGRAWEVDRRPAARRDAARGRAAGAGPRRRPASRSRGGVDRQHPRRFPAAGAGGVRPVPVGVPRVPSGVRRRIAAFGRHRHRRDNARGQVAQALPAVAAADRARPATARPDVARAAGAFFFKHHPAFAGLTMLNVDALWPETAPYLRAASTGPLTLMVLAATIARGELSVGVTYRIAELPPDAAREIGGRFATLLDALP